MKMLEVITNNHERIEEGLSEMIKMGFWGNTKEEKIKKENERIEKEKALEEERIQRAINEGDLLYIPNSTIEQLQKANIESMLKENISEANKILIRQNEIIIRLLSKQQPP